MGQRKVEENNFGIRKRLLEYDDVMNYQREAIYSRRRRPLSIICLCTLVPIIKINTTDESW